jgi:hypothetical protein
VHKFVSKNREIIPEARGHIEVNSKKDEVEILTAPGTPENENRENCGSEPEDIIIIRKNY